MNREEILKKIEEVLKTIPTIDKKKLSHITEDTDILNDLEAPSTDLVNIIAKAENAFGLEFEDDDIDTIGTKIRDVIDLIIKYLEKDKAVS